MLESIRLAGGRRAFFILRQGKWDIPAYYGHGGELNMDLAYLMMDEPHGAPYTLDQAYPFIGDADTILFGFPDILFRPENAFVRLLEHQSQTGAQIVLGVFKADNPAKMDMLVFDDRQRVRDIVIKPAETHLTHTWIIAVWSGLFSKYLHDYVAADRQQRSQNSSNPNGSELYVGDVIRAAIRDHWTVETVFFNQGAYLDVGTPEDMQKAMSDSFWTIGGEE